MWNKITLPMSWMSMFVFYLTKISLHNSLVQPRCHALIMNSVRIIIHLFSVDAWQEAHFLNCQALAILMSLLTCHWRGGDKSCPPPYLRYWITEKLRRGLDISLTATLRIWRWLVRVHRYFDVTARLSRWKVLTVWEFVKIDFVGKLQIKRQKQHND